ncbi:FAD-binding oxidoreductase [Pseudooceanicola nanhaiensis]|uniref:FAD-binding oxidoreductase n=1 Tax=Pseudooceanicola nanhaiensis TaxID=375761 RepID=UPI001CD4E821|nr:FAD-binding oxidoreductase [Pseudooceanicola nanhaiensis]MCA0919807.1 FAD-binding oxidoreductase [Pseudooceanicola nanhaiensis]
MTEVLSGVEEALIERLGAVLPPQALLTGDRIDPRYQEDRRDRFSARPRFVLRPATTQEVSDALRLCDAAGQRVVVHGGRTGLSGAHRIVEGEAVLSLERMTAVGPVSTEGATLLAEAGAPLQAVQEAASAAGFTFGVDIGARGTATIGGNIATNAGGIRVLRYGMFRAQVAGLEAVLADGTILSGLRGLEKDNSGCDLNQLFIGSEGTMGVVTKALLRLHPAPADAMNALLAVPSLEAALSLLQRLRAALGPRLTACEVMWPGAYFGICRHQGRTPPLATEAPFYLLAESQSPTPGGAAEGFLDTLMEGIEDGLALDAVVSQSLKEYETLWEIRDGGAEFVRHLDKTASGDISVPLTRMADFAVASQKAVREVDPGADFYMFGHIGDGNLHYVFTTTRKEAALDRLYHVVADHGGAISAEHGIGVDKKPWLPLARSPGEIAVMRRLKRALDPNGILNRGRIFDL